MTIKEQILRVLVKVKREGMLELISFLENSDFFKAPASTKYHGSYEGGLAEHSLNVYSCLAAKNSTYNLGIDEDTLAITALLHDACKINFYKVEQKWRKDANNKWESYETFGVDDQFPAGHGEKSVIMLQKHIKLTDLEILMIRWHMGGFEGKDNPMALQNAMSMYPEVVALHAADLEATYIIEGKKKDEILI